MGRAQCRIYADFAGAKFIFCKDNDSKRQAKLNFLFPPPCRQSSQVSSAYASGVGRSSLSELRLIFESREENGSLLAVFRGVSYLLQDSQSRVSHQIIRTLAAGSARTGSSRSKLARTGDSFEYIGGSVFRLPPSDFPVNIVKICRSRSRSALLSCELTIS